MPVDIWMFLALDPRRRAYAKKPLYGNNLKFNGNAPMCACTRHTVAIDADGELLPCIPFAGFMKKAGLSLGNVKRKPLTDLLCHGPYLDYITMTVNQFLANSSSCRSCEYREKCSSGCRAIAVALHPEDGLMGKDLSKCLYFRQGWDRRTDEGFERLASEGGPLFRSVHEFGN